MGGNLFKNFSFLSATLSFFILVGIFAVLFSYAQESMHEFGFDFLLIEVWEAGEDDEGGIFGGYIPIIGTLLSYDYCNGYSHTFSNGYCYLFN